MRRPARGDSRSKPRRGPRGPREKQHMTSATITNTNTFRTALKRTARVRTERHYNVTKQAVLIKKIAAIPLTRPADQRSSWGKR